MGRDQVFNSFIFDRFLHDVITAVITDQGILNGLFDDLEMNSENVKDKDAKVEYLTKLIDALSFSSGKYYL